MPSHNTAQRLRFTPRSLALAVVLLGVTLALIRLVAESSRVLGWMMVAAVAAGLLQIPVAWLARWLPRGLAVGVVAVISVAGIVTVGYGVGENLAAEVRRLQDSAPRAAAELERSGRFSETARRLELARWTRRFVKEVPQRLRGGTAVEALRAAATRGVAFLVTGVLTLFFLLHGPRLTRAASRQIRDAARRARLERVARSSYRRASEYIGGSVAMALLAGLVAYTAARVAHVPGPAALGLWVALWDIVPLIGAVIGAAPVVLLAAAASPTRALVLLAVFLGYQVLEAVLMQRPLERHSVRLGPFLTLAAGLTGLELYGIGGSLMAIVLVTVAVTVADELAPSPPAAEATRPDAMVLTPES